MMDAYAIVSVPLLLTTCIIMLVICIILAWWRGGDGWIIHGLTMAQDQIFGAIFVFALGNALWRVL